MKGFNMRHFKAGLVGSFVVLASAVGLVACGGGGSGASSQTTITTRSPEISIGQLVDSPISGMQYVSGGQSGFTDKYGFYKYEIGKNTTFKIGDIVIGTISPTKLATPVKMVSGAADETNPAVINIIRFIQSLDDDGDLTNGITITASMHSAAKNISIDFNQSVANFAADTNVQNALATITAVTTAGSRNLIAENTAVSNFRSGVYTGLAGTFCGSYTGDQQGTWSIDVDANGNVSGTGTSTTFGSFTISGKVKTDGSVSFNQTINGTASGATFSGDFDFTSGLSGKWSESTHNWVGDFSGEVSYTGCVKKSLSTPSGIQVSANVISYDVYDESMLEFFKSNGAPQDVLKPYSRVITVSGYDIHREDTGLAWLAAGFSIPVTFARSPFHNIFVYKNNIMDSYDVIGNVVLRNISDINAVSTERFGSFHVQDIPILDQKISMVYGGVEGTYKHTMTIAGVACDLYGLSSNDPQTVFGPEDEVCIADIGGNLKRFLYLKVTNQETDGNGITRSFEYVVRARKVEIGKTVDSSIFQIP